MAGEQPYDFLRAIQKGTVICLCWEGCGYVHEGNFRAWSVTTSLQILIGT